MLHRIVPRLASILILDVRVLVALTLSLITGCQPTAPAASPAPEIAPGAAEAPPPKDGPHVPADTLPFDAEQMTRPTPLSGDEIQFTHEAITAHVSGVLVARCRITVDGENRDCLLVKSVPSMDRAVLAALERHRGAPVTFHGRPVSVMYTYTVRLKVGSSPPAPPKPAPTSPAPPSPAPTSPAPTSPAPASPTPTSPDSASSPA